MEDAEAEAWALSIATLIQAEDKKWSSRMTNDLIASNSGFLR